MDQQVYHYKPSKTCLKSMKLWQFDAENVFIQWLKFGWKTTSGYWNIIIKIEVLHSINGQFTHQVNALFFFPCRWPRCQVIAFCWVSQSLAKASGLSGSHLTGLMKLFENFFRQFNKLDFLWCDSTKINSISDNRLELMVSSINWM